VKAKPGDVSYGSSGIGTDFHLAMVMLGAKTGATFNLASWPTSC